MGLDSTGSVTHETYDASGALVETETTPFEQTFVMRRATGGRWLNVAVLHQARAAEGPRTEAIGLSDPAQTPRAADAIAVPVTRAWIFANAMSRDVDVSSPNGENPQSSVVPSGSDRYASPHAGRGRGPLPATRPARRADR